MDDFLGRYPSLGGWEHQPVSGDQNWERRSQGSSYNSLTLYWRHDADDPPHVAAVNMLTATRYRSDGDWWVFPAVGRMSKPIHPLTACWAILYALSAMARYEPRRWASMIEIDSSPDANAIEHLLDEALDIIPSLLLEAIRLATVQPTLAVS